MTLFAIVLFMLGCGAILQNYRNIRQQVLNYLVGTADRVQTAAINAEVAIRQSFSRLAIFMVVMAALFGLALTMKMYWILFWLFVVNVVISISAMAVLWVSTAVANEAGSKLRSLGKYINQLPLVYDVSENLDFGAASIIGKPFVLIAQIRVAATTTTPRRPV